MHPGFHQDYAQIRQAMSVELKDLWIDTTSSSHTSTQEVEKRCMNE